ncbi:sulfite exporter TauE/SafE family protein [Chromobacterium haemolyticum]|uniref:Sulfite exporter TauE/SafE family protein n=1 Tax=Chromobacterium fluminis TaxID=3044269 RepID=A0ABX0L2F6_9NEIS|nr:sulfite exporter TauE/SafE family protein [Chromobacterium haemolyticum]NHR06007.1 sulfite exporter TauE/SafE family protein [Chromobacterium haemolyticum]
MIETSEWILFLAGLLGGGHCMGMCGGIVAALTLNLPPETGRWRIMLAYNLGRIGSYALIGALLGGLAATSLALLNIRGLQLALALLANLMLVAMGLYLAGLSGAVNLIERLGVPIWRRLQPLLGRLLPVRSPQSALLAGMVWGWLPCGLVYSASLSALATGSASGGALAMLAFGLGTLPNLLLMGAFADSLRRWMQQRPVRLTAGLVVAGIGAWQLLRALI